MRITGRQLQALVLELLDELVGGGDPMVSACARITRIVVRKSIFEDEIEVPA